MLPFVDQLFLTEVKGEHSGDVFFPPFEEQFTLLETDEHVDFAYKHYRRRGQNHPLGCQN